MDKRRTELSEISSYIQRIDCELTMILQSLQWDRKHLIEDSPMAPCKYDHNHRVPRDNLDDHERECRLRSLGYTEDDLLLPEPVDASADTVVTLNSIDIKNIIDYAAKIDPLFKKEYVAQGTWANCRGPLEPQPLTLARLQEAYSTDERRALHDAVVSAVPSCHDLLELALPGGEGSQRAAGKSRAEILAELRDMKRRRAKYRGAGKSRNYSDVLRDLIVTQMEHYSEAQAVLSKTSQPKNYNTTKEATSYEELHIKKEPEEDRSYSRNHETRQRDKSKDTCKEREREKRHDDYKRDKHRDERDRYSSSSKDRGRNDYRSRDKYRKDEISDLSRSRTREYGDSYKSSRNSDSRYKREREDRYDSYVRSDKQEKRKRYYDSNQDQFQSTTKRIKHERD